MVYCNNDKNIQKKGSEKMLEFDEYRLTLEGMKGGIEELRDSL